MTSTSSSSATPTAPAAAEDYRDGGEWQSVEKVRIKTFKLYKHKLYASSHSAPFHPPRRSQVQIQQVDNNQVFGYSHQQVGNEYVPCGTLVAKRPVAGLSAATTTTDVEFPVSVGTKMKAGADDQIYFLTHLERLPNNQ